MVLHRPYLFLLECAKIRDPRPPTLEIFFEPDGSFHVMRSHHEWQDDLVRMINFTHNTTTLWLWVGVLLYYFP